MKKSIFGFGAICCVSALALLSGCSQNGECCGDCKKTAAVTQTGEVTPASAKTGTCATTCSEAKKAECAKQCPMAKPQN